MPVSIAAAPPTAERSSSTRPPGPPTPARGLAYVERDRATCRTALCAGTQPFALGIPDPGHGGNWALHQSPVPLDFPVGGDFFSPVSAIRRFLHRCRRIIGGWRGRGGTDRLTRRLRPNSTRSARAASRMRTRPNRVSRPYRVGAAHVGVQRARDDIPASRSYEIEIRPFIGPSMPYGRR